MGEMMLELVGGLAAQVMQLACSPEESKQMLRLRLTASKVRIAAIGGSAVGCWAGGQVRLPSWRAGWCGGACVGRVRGRRRST